MTVDKRWRLVCYDVRDPKRYRRIYKILRGSGDPVQYSIFRSRLDDRESERLRWRLASVMDPKDALLIVDLCPSCARKVVSRNHVAGWSEAPPPFRIVGGQAASDSAHKDSRPRDAGTRRKVSKARGVPPESEA